MLNAAMLARSVGRTSLVRAQPLLAASSQVGLVRGLAEKPAAAKPAAKSKAPAKGKKKGDSGPQVVVPQTSLELGSIVPVSILKDQADPVIKPDSEYPDWLWHITEIPTLSDLRMKRKVKANMTKYEKARLKALEATLKVKEGNIRAKTI